MSAIATEKPKNDLRRRCLTEDKPADQRCHLCTRALLNAAGAHPVYHQLWFRLPGGIAILSAFATTSGIASEENKSQNIRLYRRWKLCDTSSFCSRRQLRTKTKVSAGFDCTVIGLVFRVRFHCCLLLSTTAAITMVSPGLAVPNQVRVGIGRFYTRLLRQHRARRHNAIRRPLALLSALVPVNCGVLLSRNLSTAVAVPWRSYAK